MGKLSVRLGTLTIAVLIAACAPAPSPTAAPAKPTEKPVAKATAEPAAKPAEKAAPTAAPAKPTATQPAAPKAQFDEKAVADFYRGKTVRIIVGFAPGGGYDLYSRVIAKHMGKHIPGNPTVIVENMPGAGSMTAMNNIYNSLPKDGTVIGNVAGGLVLQQLTKGPGIEFDAAKMEYLGAPSYFEYLMIVTKKSGITKLEDVLGPSGKQVVIGSTGVGSGSYNTTIVAREALDINMKLVPGYEGSSTVRLAMERGEVDGYFNSWDSTKSTFAAQLQTGEFLLLAQFAEPPISELPNVPLSLSFAKNEEQRQLLQYGIIIPNKFARPYVIAPGVPQDRVRALQVAFEKTMADKEFLAEAEKAKQDIKPLTGPELKQQIINFLNMPAAMSEKLQKVLQSS